MLRFFTIATILSAGLSSAQATDLSGTWIFTHQDDHFGGWIVLRQSGDVVQGTWHTSRGKTEPDDSVTGRVSGNIVTLWRFIGNNRQNFDMTLSPDGSRLDSFGNGYFLNHANLNMQRNGAAPATAAPATLRQDPSPDAAADLSGLWAFTHFDDRFQGTIRLRREGSYFTGTWHTSKGKTEPDDGVSCRVDGNTVTLWRFIGNERQSFVLTLSADRSRLDGYGDGYFLNHTNLNMQRAAGPDAAEAPPR